MVLVVVPSVALAKRSLPPVTITVPSAKRVALCRKRGTVMDPVVVQSPVLKKER